MYLFDVSSYSDLDKTFEIEMTGGSYRQKNGKDILEPTVAGMLGMISLFLHILEHHTDKISA